MPLPAVEDPRADRADVGDGQHEEEAQPLGRLHDRHEILDRLGIGEIALLGDVAHHQMVAHQPGDRLRIALAETEPRAKRAGDVFALFGMVALGPLGDIVQQHGDIERLARLDLVDHLRGQRVFGLRQAALDLGDVADGADQVLVDRIVVVHVELHQRDDASEIGHEASKHAALVHPAQFGLRIGARGQHLQEQPVGFGVGAQGIVDQVQRTRRGLQRDRMDVDVLLVGQMEEPQQIDRIAAEDVVAFDGQAAAVDQEARRHRLPPVAEAEQPAEARRALLVLVLQHGAENARQVADFLRGKEVVLHEALDGGGAVLAIPEPPRHLALYVEAEALLGPPGQEVQVAAHGPEKGLGALERGQLVGGEDAFGDEFARILDPVDILGDPEQRVEIAQAPFALLDVGLHQIAALAGPRVALVTLGQFRLHEVQPALADDVLLEARLQLVEERPVAPQIAGLQDAGADGHIRPGKADALVDRARRMTNLLPQIPQRIEHELDRALAPGSLLVGKHEQQIDVRARSERTPAIATHGNDRDALGGRGILRIVDVLDGEVVERPDDLVFGGREPPRGVEAGTAGLQQRSRRLACLAQRLLQDGDGGLAQDLGVGAVGRVSRRGQAVAQRHAVDGR